MTEVVVVDVDSDFRAAVVEALDEHDGYTVVGQASDPAEAIEAVGALRPAVVIVDLDVSRLAGAQLISRIRRGRIAVGAGLATCLSHGADSHDALADLAANAFIIFI